MWPRICCNLLKRAWPPLLPPLTASRSWALSQPAVDALFLHVLSTNATAMRFYAEQGFRNHKRETGFYPINSSLEDAFLYIKYLRGVAPQPSPPPESLWHRVWGALSRAVLKVVILLSPLSAPSEAYQQQALTRPGGESLV
jgi:hypothetical protein